MGFEFRVSGFEFKARRLQEMAGAALRSMRGWRRLANGQTAIEGISPRADAQLESRNAQPEAFFDAEFLKKLEQLHLIAKRLDWTGLKGEHAAPRRGFSLEFSDYRRYQHGDDLRYVDWNIYRRLDRLLLKVFTAEEELNIYLLLDASRSMDRLSAAPATALPAKLDYAKKVAAALGYIGLKNLDRVGGAVFNDHLAGFLKLARGRAQILRLFGFLAGVSCSGGTDLRSAVHKFTNLFPQPGLVVVLSDLFDPSGWRAALEELARKRYQVLVIHVIAEEELAPRLAGDLALVDAEGGRERQMFIDRELGRRYEEELAKYLTEIETLCAGRGIDYLRTTTRTPFDEFVLKSLRQVTSVS